MQGNPVKEFSRAARVLSREYHLSLSDPKEVMTEGTNVLQRASCDFYSRSISGESIDGCTGSPEILHSMSSRTITAFLIVADAYYTAQELVLPSTKTQPTFALPEGTDINALLNRNMDAVPPPQQGIHIKVLRPLYGKLQDRRLDWKDQETASFLHDGIQTNLVGRLFLVSVLTDRIV